MHTAAAIPSEGAQLNPIHRLTVSPELLGVEPLPVVSAALPGLVEAVALLDTTRLLADRSKTTGFAVLGSS